MWGIFVISCLPSVFKNCPYSMNDHTSSSPILGTWNDITNLFSMKKIEII